MAINLDTPKQVTVGPSKTANRWEIGYYHVDNRVDGQVLTIAHNVMLTEDDPNNLGQKRVVAGSIENLPSVQYDGDRLNQIIAAAGVTFLQDFIALASLPGTATVADIAALLATSDGATAAGLAYYHSTRDTMYAAMTADSLNPLA